MAFASSSTSCLRASNRATAIDRVNPSSRPSEARMPPSIDANWGFVFPAALDSALRPRRNPASLAMARVTAKRTNSAGDMPVLPQVSSFRYHQ